jgi:hypothetical protein
VTNASVVMEEAPNISCGTKPRRRILHFFCFLFSTPAQKAESLVGPHSFAATMTESEPKTSPWRKREKRSVRCTHDES